MKIACIGAGYVGGPTMAMIAYKCPTIEVVVCDINPERIRAWNSDELPIYEPGLLEIVQVARGRNLFFSSQAKVHIASADIIFVSVNTPTKVRGVGAGRAANLTYWENSARLIASACRPLARPAGSPPLMKVVVEKSTVPVKTAEAISKVLKCNGDPGMHFEILSNPEFMAEGTAVEDLRKPDRVLIGGRDSPEGSAAVAMLRSVYEHWVPPERILSMSLWSAELSKLAANAFLAQRISSTNAMAALCEETGADIQQVMRCVGADTRIGNKFLSASVGFGGSCFQKDILSLVYLCTNLGLLGVAAYWQKVVEINDWSKGRFVARVIASMFTTIRSKRIAVLGFSFKANTGDTRETPAVDVCHGLLHDGAIITVYDPQVPASQIQHEMCTPKHAWDHPVSPNVSSMSLQTVEVANTAYEACHGCHAICLLTEWDEFAGYDYRVIHDNMVKPAFLFDGRNVLDHAALRRIGFVVYGLGRPLDEFVRQHGGDL